MLALTFTFYCEQITGKISVVVQLVFLMSKKHFKPHAPTKKDLGSSYGVLFKISDEQPRSL